MRIAERFTNFFRYEPERKQKDKKYIIEENSKGRIAPSVDDFIRASEAASSKIIQHRITLYNHYQQTLMYDSHVNALVKKRLENIGNKTLVLYDGENKVESHDEFFSSPKFRSFLQDIVFSHVFMGMGVFQLRQIEYNETPWFDYFKFPEKHVNPFAKEILKFQHDDHGQPFSDDPTMMFVGDENSLGIMLQVTLLSLYRRLGMFNYGKYVDLASENFMRITAREFGDNNAIAAVQEQLSRRDGGGMITLPDGVNLESGNQSSSSQNQLFENYMSMLKDELAILILGQTMTTEDGSSRSQAEVHELEQQSKYTADEQLLLDILNYEFLEKIDLWGLTYKPTMKFKFEPTSDDEVRMQLRNLTALKELGMEFTQEELREKFKALL